jgi:hypothetical protein
MKNNNEIARMKMLAGLITESQYRKSITELFSGERSDLVDYTVDITVDEIDDYGDFDEDEDVFYVESGSDEMADIFDAMYNSEATGMEWWEDEETLPFLSNFYDYLLNKAVKEKYGNNVEIESA